MNKIICKICGKETTKKGIGIHLLKTHRQNPEQYYDSFLKKREEGKCLNCGEQTSYYGLTKGYRPFCSNLCATSSSQRKEKIKKTNLKKYGVGNPFQSNLIKEQIKKTNIRKYGTENISKLKEIIEKRKETNLKNWGTEWSQQSELIKNKIKKTNLKKYGVTSILKLPEIRQSISEKQRKVFLSKSYDNIVMQIKDILPMFNKEQWKGIGQGKVIKYEWKCLKCNSVFEDDMSFGMKPICRKCYPISTNSMPEIEIRNFLKENSIDYEPNKRIEGKEIDVFITNKNIGIELDGIYWHSERAGKYKNYHLNKTNFCKNIGIKLIHIFDNEWKYKKEIVKSIILNKTGKTQNKIFARKCFIKEMLNNEKNTFLKDNHLQGQDKSKIFIGLMFNNEIVSVMTFGKSRFNKKYEWELMRFCNKLNVNVVGGFSKLLFFFIKKYKPKTIITYADKRFSDGCVYSKNGFVLIHESAPNYFYTKNHKELFSRQQFQKHKLKDKLTKFDGELTEWENMKNNGYDRIWDCGNYVFVLDNKTTEIKE